MSDTYLNARETHIPLSEKDYFRREDDFKLRQLAKTLTGRNAASPVRDADTDTRVKGEPHMYPVQEHN